MQKTAFTLSSSNGKSRLSAFLYAPEGDPRAVVQICHGMCEYIERYEPMIEVLCSHGFAVCGCDHLGHGSTAELNGTRLGVFGDVGSWSYLVEDQEQLRREMRLRYPTEPYFLLGHSMGSFIARLYAARHGKELTALLVSGTSGKNPAAGAGKLLVKLVSLFKGRESVSGMLYMLTTGNYNKKVGGGPTGVEWICHDEGICQKYIHDPWCSYIFSTGGFGELMELVDRCNRNDCFAATPKDLPVWLFSGAEDPVGNNGKGVTEVYNKMKAAGVKDVTLTLYPGDRHEVHNEADREQLFEDIISYLNKYSA